MKWIYYDSWWLFAFVFNCELQVLLSAEGASRNNACRSLEEYRFIQTSKKCYHNPNVLSNVPRIVKMHGYPLERHKVVTEDGYILTLFRIFSPSSSGRQPVVIQHGIGGSAAFWVLHDEDSLAFVLYKNGYDVWLPSIRGSTNSMQHTNLTRFDPKYWDFSFHEMGIYDVPAITSYIAKVTSQKGNIIYIGHSMGSTMSYIYSSLNKKHADSHLRGLISFSPVAYMRNVKGLFKILAPFTPGLTQILNSLGIYAIGDIPIINRILQKLCSHYPTATLCAVGSAFGAGLSLEETRVDLMPVLTSYFPAGTSLKTINHYAQYLNNGGMFREFDYEGMKNLARYYSIIPPDYPVWKIELPVFLFIGQQDFLATKPDVDILQSKLQSSPTVEKYYFNYAHNDFFAGNNFTDLYKTLLDVMRRLGPT